MKLWCSSMFFPSLPVNSFNGGVFGDYVRCSCFSLINSATVPSFLIGSEHFSWKNNRWQVCSFCLSRESIWLTRCVGQINDSSLLIGHVEFWNFLGLGWGFGGQFLLSDLAFLQVYSNVSKLFFSGGGGRFDWLPKKEGTTFWLWPPQVWPTPQMWKVRTFHNIQAWKVMRVLCAAILCSNSWLSRLYKAAKRHVSDHFSRKWVQ